MLFPCLEDGSGADVEDLNGTCLVAGDHNTAISSDFGAVGNVVEAGNLFEEFAGADGEDLDAGSTRNYKVIGGSSEDV